MTKKSDILITPIDKFWANGEKEALAIQLTHMLKLPELLSHLDDRCLLRKVGQHTSKESESRVGLYRAYEQHKSRTLGTFVIATTAGEVKGLATVEPDSLLRRHNIGLPVPTLSSKIVTDVHVPGPKVTSWLRPKAKASSDSYLSKAYRTLADPNGIASDFYQQYVDSHVEADEVVAYTLEPLSSPDWIHSTVRTAGFVEVDKKYYTDRTSRFAVPVMSRYSLAPVTPAA